MSSDDNLEKRVRVLEANLSELQDSFEYNKETCEIMRRCAVSASKNEKLSKWGAWSMMFVALVYLYHAIYGGLFK